MDQPVIHLVDEPELLRKARWGDRPAFAELYARHAGAVHALALRLTGDAHAAEDLTHDAFMKMLRFIGGLRSDRPVRPWLKKVVANAAIDRLRKAHAGLYADVDESLCADAAATHAPEHYSDAGRLLQRLDPMARTLVWLHEVEGWSHTELAERFGRSPSWSKSQISRALSKLRRDLDAPSQPADSTASPPEDVSPRLNAQASRR